MEENNKSKVDELSDVLYSRTRYHDPADKRSRLETSSETPEVTEEWKGPNLDEMLKSEREKPSTHPIIKKFFTFSLIFFVLAVLIAAYVIFGGSNFISSKNVDISVLGPTSISAGEIMELGVTVSNKNNAGLELANLSIQYPEGTRDPLDTSKTLTYSKEDLGEIGAGREVVRNVKMVLFGATGDIKEIKFSIEYKVKGSNATFFKDKVYQIVIGDAPLTFNVGSPGSVNSGETFTTVINVSLKSAEILKNVMVRGEYPYGYTITEATPEALVDNNVWTLGDLSPGDKKTITIRGRLLGEHGEERTFRFYTGVSDENDNNPNFKTIIASTQNTIAIDKPAIALSALFNGENVSTYIAPLGRPISASIRYQNNLPEKLLNPRLEVKFSGVALDKSSVSSPDGGFYNSSGNKLVWDIKGTSGVAELLPGDSGRISFNFSSLANLQSSASAREIIMEIVFTGTPLGGSVSKPVTVSETRTIKIASEVSLSSKALHSRGPFPNKGSIPPRADIETTYTIVWTVGNTQAEVSDAYITANLGQNVIWIGPPSSSGEDISYDQSANIITWNIGTLASGAGFSTPTREVAFQVSLTPSIGQIGTLPTLVSGANFFGIDTITSQPMRVTNSALTTRLSSDPAFVQGDEYVVK